MNDITTAGVCSGMYLVTQVGRLSLNAPWIIPTNRLSTVTGRPGVAGPAADLHEDRARILAGTPGDAARVTGGAALLAGDLSERRFRADAVDREAVVVGHRHHLGRIEFDHRVVEGVVARNHGSQHTSAFGGLGGDLRARATAVRGGETDELAGGIAADRRQGAHACLR